jgi:hypothetical protein
MAYMVENCKAVVRGQEGFCRGCSGSGDVCGSWRRAGTARTEIADIPPVKRWLWFSMGSEGWAWAKRARCSGRWRRRRVRGAILGDGSTVL